MRRSPALPAGAVLLPVAVLVSITIGTADISIADAFRALLSALGFDSGELAASTATIVLRHRLPRTLLAISSGASLALAGAVLQAVFLNPMADPYVMGISSGSAFGVAVAIVAGASTGVILQISALAGAAIALVAVLGISLMAGRSSRASTLLLSGISVSVMFSAALSLIMYLNHTQAEKIMFWTFGSLSAGGWNKLGSVLGFQLLGIVLILLQWKDANLLSQGDEHARSLGIVPGRARLRLLLSASFATAVTVSATGIIAFAGLMVPHAIRMLHSPDHRSLFPLTAVYGAMFLLAADSIARVLLSPSELPVGVITALLGAPYLLIILVRDARKGGFL